MYVQTTYGNVKEKPLMLQLGKDQIYIGTVWGFSEFSTLYRPYINIYNSSMSNNALDYVDIQPAIHNSPSWFMCAPLSFIYHKIFGKAL